MVNFFHHSRRLFDHFVVGNDCNSEACAFGRCINWRNFKVNSKNLKSLFNLKFNYRALGHMLSTLVFPIFPLVLYLIVFVIWGLISIWLSSMGTENCQYVNEDNPQDLNNGRPCDCSKMTPIDSNAPYVTLFSLKVQLTFCV